MIRPTPSAPAPPARAAAAAPARAVRALLALALATSWVLWAALPGEAAVMRAGFDSPGEGARVEGPVTLAAFVEHAPPGSPDRVETRFLKEGQTAAGSAHALSKGSSRDQGGVTRTSFSAQLDPLAAPWFGGKAIPNGRYVIEMRVRETFGDSGERWTGWGSGRSVVVDAPPPSTQTDARLQDPAARTVQVAWAPTGAAVPDFTRYVVERAEPGESFLQVHVAVNAETREFTDTVPADGSYRYRVTVHRLGADGTERASAPAESGSVTVHPDAAPEHDGDGDGDREQSQDPDEEGDQDAEGSTARRGSGGSLQSGGLSVPRSGARPPRSGEIPRTAPSGQDPSSVFEDRLDYGEVPEMEETVTERGYVGTTPDAMAREGGGMLNIMERELAPEQILVPVAAGMVFTLTAFHVRRFLNS